MQAQQRIAADFASAAVGSRLRVLVETPFTARTAWDAPEVDCKVFLEEAATPGDFLDVQVTGARVYDLEARAISQAA